MADQLNLSVGDLFIGAIAAGMLQGALYPIYIILIGLFKPDHAPLRQDREKTSGKVIGEVLKTVLPPLGLIVLVLGSIFAGVSDLFGEALPAFKIGFKTEPVSDKDDNIGCFFGSVSD